MLPTIDALYQTVRHEPSDINEHLDVLRSLSAMTDTLGEGKVVEFGTRFGVSTIALLAGRPKSLVTYDLDPSMTHGARSTLAPCAEQVGVQFQALTADTASMPKIEPCDLLFVDTYHTFGQLARELNRHGDQARLWIALHDTEAFGKVGEDGARPGLQQAVDMFVAESDGEWKVRSRFTHNNGLTVLERRTK